jgi:hypothetical protein
VRCKFCSNTVGLKKDLWFGIRQHVVVNEIVSVGILSLKPVKIDCINIPGVVVAFEQLTKATLRNYVCTAKYHTAILVHRCEGRVLLTDRNGFYTQLLAAQFHSTKGNVIIVLTAVKDPIQD